MAQISRQVHSLDELAVHNLREYLKIPSVHPDVNYGPCVKFLTDQAKSLGLPISVHYCFPGKPIIILTWTGQKPNLPSILLNSHTDVVPVYEEQWTYPPFGAEMDGDGNIYARGAQDMKCVGIQYLEAIRRLKRSNVTFKRTIHVSFVPDEEIGSVEGMQAFIKSKEFQALNVGFALDEGVASLDDVYYLFYGENSAWQFFIHCPGQSGHGSMLLDNTPGEKVNRILERIYEFRTEQKNNEQETGDATSINLTQIQGGVQTNVIPAELTLGFDCRVSPNMDMAKFEEDLNQWCKEAGEDVWIEFTSKEPKVPVTNLDESNPYWVAFKKATDKLNLQLNPSITKAASDSRFLRTLEIPAIGFSPMIRTPQLLHTHNEHLNKNVFLRGIDIYCEIIPAVANIDA